MLTAGGNEGFLCWNLDQCPLLSNFRKQNCLMTIVYTLLLVVIGAAGTDESTGVTERGGLCFRAVLAGNLIALSFFQDCTLFNYSVDEEHSGEGAGVIACHSGDTTTLGTLNLLVPLLFQ